MTTERIESQRAFRLNVTVKPSTHGRLQEARNKKGIEINVSEITDKAINAELDRRERPGVADLVARLTVESDRRRGAPYREGFFEGQGWARTCASWAEICEMASLEEGDVHIDLGLWSDNEGNEWERPQFSGAFVAPEQDYGRRRVRAWGAPSFESEKEGWTDDVHLLDQYWRGWLGGVREVFELVRSDLAPVEGGHAQKGAISPPAEGGARDVDPDDIPF